MFVDIGVWTGCVDRRGVLPSHTPTPEIATEAGGTHLTGMHTCLFFVDYLIK